MSRAPGVSVVICSHNGGTRLANALSSLEHQSLAAEAYEIVVVDNASTDNTSAVVSSHQERIPNLRYIREDQLGLSYARNAGLQRAHADIIAYMDDDAVACTHWLKNIRDAFLQFDCGIVCGPVEPIWPAKRPDWLDDDLLSVYSIVNWGAVPRSLRDNEWVVGTNMAFSRQALGSDRFDTRLGRHGENLISDEETDLVNNLRKRGHQVIYHPAARIEHCIDPKRLTCHWYLRRMYWQGFSDGLRSSGIDTTTRYILFKLKEIADTLTRPEITFVCGTSKLRRLGHVTEQLGKIRGRLA